MNWIIEPILNVTIEAGHKAVPQSPLGEHKEAKTIYAMHELHNAGKE